MSKSTKRKNYKKRIIETASRLIAKKGYANVSAREIARESYVRDGTLYYHFPKGKIDIMIALAQEKIDELLSEEVEKLNENASDADIEGFFLADIKKARKLRDFSIAIEIEMLSNPHYYVEIANSLWKLEDFYEPLTRVVKRITKKDVEPETQKRILTIWKVLLLRHVIYENTFGSDNDFTSMMIKIIRTLAEN